MKKNTTKTVANCGHSSCAHEQNGSDRGSGSGSGRDRERG